MLPSIAPVSPILTSSIEYSSPTIKPSNHNFNFNHIEAPPSPTTDGLNSQGSRHISGNFNPFRAETWQLYTKHLGKKKSEADRNHDSSRNHNVSQLTSNNRSGLQNSEDKSNSFITVQQKKLHAQEISPSAAVPKLQKRKELNRKYTRKLSAYHDKVVKMGQDKGMYTKHQTSQCNEDELDGEYFDDIQERVDDDTPNAQENKIFSQPSMDNSQVGEGEQHDAPKKQEAPSLAFASFQSENRPMSKKRTGGVGPHGNLHNLIGEKSQQQRQCNDRNALLKRPSQQ